MYNIPQNPDCIIIAHVLKVNVINLQKKKINDSNKDEVEAIDGGRAELGTCYNAKASNTHAVIHRAE